MRDGAAEADTAVDQSLDETLTTVRSGRPRDPALDRAVIEATRRRLARDGYSNMTIGDIALDAGVSRPTIYRRWTSKLELTVDAVRYGFEALIEAQPLPDLSHLPGREALTEAVRWIDPCAVNADAMVFMGNFMGEALRTPELMHLLSQHGIEPRLTVLEQVLVDLQRRGEVREDVDIRTVASLCFGAYFAEFLRGGADGRLAEAVVSALWPSLASVAAR